MFSAYLYTHGCSCPLNLSLSWQDHRQKCSVLLSCVAATPRQQIKKKTCKQVVILPWNNWDNIFHLCNIVASHCWHSNIRDWLKNLFLMHYILLFFYLYYIKTSIFVFQAHFRCRELLATFNKTCLLVVLPTIKAVTPPRSYEEHRNILLLGKKKHFIKAGNTFLMMQRIFVCNESNVWSPCGHYLPPGYHPQK